jgi:activator of 2-hydroxyglutaryl-CoA dehydratase
VDIKEPVIMVGGTSLIEGLVHEMGELLQTSILVPEYSQYIGSVGSALLTSGFVKGE